MLGVLERRQNCEIVLMQWGKGRTNRLYTSNKNIKPKINANSLTAAHTLNSSLSLKTGKSLEVIPQGAKG